MFFWRGWKPGRVSYIPGQSPARPELERNGKWIRVTGENGTYRGFVVDPTTVRVPPTIRFQRGGRNLRAGTSHLRHGIRQGVSAVCPEGGTQAALEGRGRPGHPLADRLYAGGPGQQIEARADFETFFAQVPAFNLNASLIKGVVCGVRVEEVEDPLMRQIRYLDKLVDELAKGKAMDRILRQ